MVCHGKRVGTGADRAAVFQWVFIRGNVAVLALPGHDLSIPSRVARGHSALCVIDATGVLEPGKTASTGSGGLDLRFVFL
jgi:hypothetical protein